MKRLLKIIIIFVIFGAVAYLSRDIIRTRFLPFVDGVVSSLHNAFVPCSEPIKYAVGTFDTKFNISKNYFLGALADAEAIWEKPFGKQLFVYAPSDGNLKINLVYDYRQQATSKLQSIGLAVKDDKVSYDALKVRYEGLEAQYSQIKDDYDVRVKVFDEKQNNYQQQVEYWNAKGGAPRQEYDALQAQQVSLRSELADLQIMQNRVNEIVSEINALVVVLNRLAGTLNLSVDKYNTIGASLGESFEEGLYRSSSVGQEIDIYEFSSRDKLVRVLAHELGHALGLEHVTDTKAIMYKFNQGSNNSLSKADLAELDAKCGVK